MITAPAIAAITPILSEWITARTARPLATWSAWDGEITSQRELCQLLERHKTVLALGGNRSGKTEWLRAIVVAMVLGSDHPDARAFWLHNGCDPDAFPKGPAKGAIFARRSNDSINYHRRNIEALLPRAPDGTPLFTWWNKNGRGEARVEIEVPGYDTPAEILFKSEDQGEDAAQGDEWRISAHDEEGDTNKVWSEAGVRLWDQDGWQIMSNTPVKGRTWIYYEFVQPPPGSSVPPRTAVRWIHTTDNPFLAPQKALTLKENAVLAAARLRGEFVVLEGRVWPMFARETHVIEPFEIPASWPRFRAIDFGTRNPFGCGWATLTPKACWVKGGQVLELAEGQDPPEGANWIPDGVLIGYREHYQAEMVLSQHVRAIRLAEGWDWADVGDDDPELVPVDGCEVFEMTWADPEDPQQLASLNVDHDMDATPAMRSVKHGIDKVATRMRVSQIDGWPGFVLMSCCPNWIREVEGYIWKPGQSGKTPEEPLKKDDHMCDVTRYLTVGVETW